MRLEKIELREVQARLRFRFETSFGVEQELRKVILILYSEGLEGYGEATANHIPGYSYETTDTVWEALTRYILPHIIGKSYQTPAQLLDDLKHIRGHNMAVAAVESAFWDLCAKAANLPLWQLLGGSKTQHEVGASLGIQKSIQETLDIALAHQEQGYKRLKFKIKPGWDYEPLRAVREALPDMALTVDANSAYRMTSLRTFHALDELNLDYIEQPLAHDDLFDHAKLQQKLKTPLCLDESIHSPEHARKALSLEAGQIINVKLGRVRGYLQSRRIHDIALSFGLPVWCGGMLELGIGRAHNLHLSSLEGFSLPGDTASADRYWEEDIVSPWLNAKEGIQTIPKGPGLGISLNRDLINHLSLRTQEC